MDPSSSSFPLTDEPRQFPIMYPGSRTSSLTTPLNGEKKSQSHILLRRTRRLLRATLALALITLLSAVTVSQVIRHNAPLYPRFAPRQQCVIREASVIWRTRYWSGLEHCVVLRGGFVHDNTMSQELHVGYGRDECVSTEDAARQLVKWYLSLDSIDCTWLYQDGDMYLSPFYGMMFYVRLQRIVKASIALVSFCAFCTCVCGAWWYWLWRRRRDDDDTIPSDDPVLFV